MLEIEFCTLMKVFIVIGNSNLYRDIKVIDIGIDR